MSLFQKIAIWYKSFLFCTFYLFFTRYLVLKNIVLIRLK
ncbi:unnamed protein product [Arabidopsis halleri]